ncbi:hypothetical protein [Mycolicibacterium mageritense]|uniref:hypothetical protein n=1 Tax=Mycolicibacterium mageritense TaxID=53462 RepID=UPI0013D68272|nr:hypothetical protein [Mycolicibacterium mageritense]MCC9181559.1 hypothetical protein [Mycolicibacterium mageritense]
MGEVGSVEVARSVKPRRSWVRVGLVAGVAVAATVAMIVMTAGLLPPQRGAAAA